MGETKRCSKCEQVKSLEEFYRARSRSTVNPWCKDCYREWHRNRYVPKPGASDEPRNCAMCGSSYRPKQRKVSIYCSRKCGQDARKASGRERDAYLTRTYGITHADYERMLAGQGGGCALCGVRPQELTSGRFRTYLHVDHDEATGRVRGLLCPAHNLLIGQWNHDPALLRRAADYIEREG